MVYQTYYSPDGSMKGYTDFTLSYMDVGSFKVSEEDKKLLKGGQYCRYFGYREPPNSTKPYALTSVFWYIVAAKVIFISVFIVAVFSVIWIISCVVPEVPRKIATAKERDRETINRRNLHNELERNVPLNLGQQNNPIYP
ncbi:unnamed protein product [Hymenolepis diminuta]|uniref:Anoctamin n=1 Tax=Hymenolepis diminuta TaxID=6216 RepID=A0A3P6ZVB9_HYMDI|nr:unnamed protein product [Hymenolepis diminuta]